MPRFSTPADDYPVVDIADTDKPLPKRINPHTRYAYFKTIARGGRSIIQSCKDLHLMRTVCYKSLKPEFAGDAAEQRRFVREARISAMLQHPNTVPTYEIGRDLHGHCYFTMKLVRGYTFREVLDYRERYDFSRLIEVLIQVARALDYAHGHGVVHRDIKPENVLVGPFGEVLLMDWGLAKVRLPAGAVGAGAPAASGRGSSGAVQLASAEITADGDLQGTVSYMSPEQIRQAPDIDHRTDIYSLGSVLYEVLAGTPPARGATLHEILQSTLDAEIEPPSRRAKADLPPRLEAICLACLRREAADRMPNAATLIRELQEDW